MNTAIDNTTLDQYRRMFHAACSALGEISDDLGVEPEDGGAEPILEAIAELRAKANWHGELLEFVKFVVREWGHDGFGIELEEGDSSVIDRARLLIAKSEGNGAPAYSDSTQFLHIGDSAFENWYSGYATAGKSDKQRARDAYAAGMGDLLVVAAPAAVAGPSETVKFVDESTADPVEKARRYLKAMGDQRMNSAYFFDDGYPRREISQGALATLAVLEQLAAAPTTQAAPQQEPVAWRHSKTLCLYETKAEVPLADGDECAEPLYLAAPQPAPVVQGNALPREDFALMVVQEACETEQADEDDTECIRILRIDLKSAVLSAFLREDAARAQAQAKEGGAA